MSAGGRWLSAYLDFDGRLYDAEADRVVLDVVAPVARRCRQQGWARRFFFLRHGRGGPHVRFRLLGDPATLRARVRPLVLARAAAAAQRVREVRWVPYEPETRRYGGPRGVAEAERLFSDSSRVAIDILAGLGAGDRSARLGKALLATATGLAVFTAGAGDGGAELAARLVASYGSAYLRQVVGGEEDGAAWNRAFERGFDRQADTLRAFVTTAWRELTGPGDGLPREIARYRAGLRRCRDRLHRLVEAGALRDWEDRPIGDWFTVVQTLLPSYLHMMNNRLGATVAEESYLSLVLASALAPELRRESA